MHYDYNTAKLIAAERNCGFWQCNNLCFFDKIECIKYAMKCKTKAISFHFYDEIFGLYDWKKEPTESLDELYKLRACQLRDKSDYLILMLSGGSDSTNMLKSFLANGLKVDEVLSVFPLQAIEKLKKNFDGTNIDPKNNMFEYTHAVQPLLQRLSVNHPDIKITVLDCIDNTLKTIEKNNFYKFARKNGIINHASGFFYTALDYVKSLDKKCTIVFAIDKPRISYNVIEKKWYSRFLDFHTNYVEFDYGVFSGERPKVEYFYYTPDLPQITIKQSILIKRFLESVSMVDHPDSQLYKDLVTEKIFKGQVNLSLDTDVHNNVIKKILYKDWIPETFQSKKGTSVFYNENYFSWFYNFDLVPQKLKLYHEGQLKELLDGIDPFFIDKMTDDKPARLKFYSTKFYEI